jgi:ABC-2 type transport system permease protein
MSITTQSRPTSAPVEGPSADNAGVTFPRVLRSEWIKFSSLRSSWITLAITIVVQISFGALLAWDQGKNWATLDEEGAALSSVLEGYILAQLVIGVLGVLFVSGEYGTGMIRSTLTAVPRRTPVLLAKAVVFTGVAMASMTIAALGAFYAGQAVLSSTGHDVTLAAPGALRSVLGTAGYLAFVGLIGGGLGWILRSTAAGIATLFGILLVIPLMMQTLSWSWLNDLGKYLPSEAGGSLISTYQVPDTLTPGVGFAVLLVWTVAVLGIGAVMLKRRDG